MKSLAKGGGKATVSAVITRADGTVEDWGRIVHTSEAERRVYEIANPKVMINRARWRIKQWLRLSQTQD